MIVNEQNFIRWDDYSLDTGQPELPRPYERDRGACPYMPVAYPTEACSFYINKPDGFTLAALGVSAFSNLRLDLVNAASGASVNNIAPLAQYDMGDGHFQIYSTVVFPDVANGQYYLRIMRLPAGIPVLASNNLQLRHDKAQLDIETTYVRFRHDRWLYGVPYQDLIGFYQQFRLHLNTTDEQYDSDRETYREVTSGKNRTLQSFLNKYNEIEAYWFDKKAHEAMAVAIEHSYFEMNGREYKIKSGYKKDKKPESGYQKATFETWDDSFGSVNRC